MCSGMSKNCPGTKQFCFTGQKLVVSSRDTVRKTLESQIFSNEGFCPCPEGSKNLVDGLKHSFLHSTNKY